MSDEREPPTLEYRGRYGEAPFRVHQAVEVIGDDNYPCRSGIVVRVHHSLMGWRFEVALLQQRVYVGLANLRALPKDTMPDRQLEVVSNGED